jgi:hypothetical protein
MKSGNLNFLEPSGPLQACNGTAAAAAVYKLTAASAFQSAAFKYERVIDKKFPVTQELLTNFQYFLERKYV